jgi:hypothetical protein
MSQGLPSSELSKEDIVDLLADEAPVTEEKREEPSPKEKDKEKEKEEPEEKEEEIQLEGIEEEEPEPDTELTLPFRRQELLKAYPDIFKKFPYLETAYYRDQKFTELLGTPEEAREIVEKAEALDQLQGTIVKGDMETVLKTVKENNPNGFGQVVDGYLSTLNKVDPHAFQAVIGNLIKDTIVAMNEEGGRIENDDLKNAALILNQFVFGTSKFTPQVRYAKPEDNKTSEAEERIKQRERQFVEKTFRQVNEDLNSRVSNILKSTIDRHIDPKSSLSDYEKKNAIRDTLESVQGEIDKDLAFTRILDNLWKKAFERDFDKRSIDNIRTAYLSKAKTVLPDVIKKVRAEALRDKKRASTTGDKRGPLPPNRNSTSSTNRGRTSEEKPSIPRGMTTLDYLNED